MRLSERIEARLAALGMSQAELGRRANVPQSTINTMIRRDRRSSPHLIAIARELKTSPAYLMGETDDPELEFEAEFYTAEERRWIDWLRAATPGDRKALTQLAKTIATSAQSATLHDKNQEYRVG